MNYSSNEEMSPPPPEPLPHSSKVPPPPPVFIANDFYEDPYGLFPKQEERTLLSPENIRELPPHISLYMEFPLKIIEAYDKQFRQRRVPISFCLNCGDLKESPWCKCLRCSYQPKILRELATHFATTAFTPKYKKYTSEQRLTICASYIESSEKLIRIVANLIFKKSLNLLIDLRNSLSE